MMKWFVVLTALIFLAETSFADDGTGYVSTTEANAGCVECNNSINSSNESLRRFVQNMNDISNGAMHVDKIVSDDYAPLCEKFVDNGQFKSLGKVVIQEVHRPENSALYDGTSDLVAACPMYKSMSRAQKDGLWVLFTAGWTHRESSCDAHPREHSGPTKRGTKRAVLAGILQLDKNHEGDYTYGTLCENGDSSTPERSLRCSFSMLSGWIEKGNNLFSNGSYWEVLRPNARVHKGQKVNGATGIKRSFKEYPPCWGSTVAKRNDSKSVAQN